MSQLSKQQHADLAKDSYENRVVTPPNKTLLIGGNHYRVLAVHKNPTTDYQGVVYQDVRTNEIVVAHRGTSSLMDVNVDLKMVIHKANIQAEDAAKLTIMALKEADKFHNKHPEQSQPRITQVGHSLGGTLAQIQSYRFKQEGVTFNAYGAAALNGIPKGGDKVINYSLASDAVSAAALGTSQGMTNATLFSVQRNQYLIGELNPHLNRVGMHINESASIPAVESLNQIQQATRQFEYDEQQRQIAQTQTRGMSLS